jgi:enoyl-CoA hydratase/carnithine racemase/carbon monoxide dehydrogenase subunit G
MEMNDEIRLEASREAVWEALNNPDVLKACIPGCETLEKVSDTEFVSLVVAKVGPIKAKFSGKVTLADIVPMSSYRLIGEGQGGVAGFAKSDIQVQLVPEGDAVTVLRYGVTANIGGKLAQLGTRLIDSTARKMADQFFAKFNEMVCAKADEADTGAAAPASVSNVAVASVDVGDHIVVTLVDVVEEAENDAAVAPSNTANNNGNNGAKAGFGSKLAQLFGAGAQPQPINQAPAAPVSGAKNAANKNASAGRTYKAAVVTLNRPERRNAMSLAMWRGLGQIFTALGNSPEVRAIILTGAGGNFSAGADISEFATVRATVEQGVEYEIAVDECCDAMAATPKPTIAVVNGFCMGGACNLAMSCDFRFAASNAQFGIPAARLSIVYGVRGTQRLLALVGVANAKRILYSAAKFGADEAHRIGFADRVAADPMRAAKSFAAVMADNAPLTIAGTKVLLTGLTMGMGTLDDVLVNKVIDRAVGSEDYKDARQAFVEKRQPAFIGK